MNRRGFLRSLAATAAGVLVPADSLASPGRVYFDMGRRSWIEYGALVGGLVRIVRPGIYMMAATATRVDGWAVNIPHTILVTPEAIAQGREILPRYFPPGYMIERIHVQRVADIGEPCELRPSWTGAL